MSMPGGARSSPDASIRALARRAHALRRAGRLDRALEGVRDAASAWPMAAELVALECGLLIDGGHFDGVLSKLDAALSRLRASDPTASVRLASARLHLEAGRLHALQQRLAPARTHLMDALAAPALHTLEGEPGACVRIRAQAVLGAVLCIHAEHAEGLQRLEQALADCDALGPDAVGLERVRILINLGGAHFEQQRLDEARRHIDQALALLPPLVRLRRAGARADLGRALINLGGIHSNAGRLDEAVNAYRGALDALDRAARSTAQAGDLARLRAARAKASMNLGYALFKAGDFDAAERHLATALRRYAPLLQANPHLRADVARARINAARLAARRGQADRAAALYARALADFESMMDNDAAPYLAGDAANAQLGVARAALVRGQTRRSARLFDAAMATLHRLTHEGQLHQAPAWLRAWVEQASVWVEHGDDKATAVMLPALLRVLEAPPLRALGELEEPLRMPAAALDALQRWHAAACTNSARAAAVQALTTALLQHLLDATAQVLAESSPAWLALHEAAMQAWVLRLGDAAAAQPDAAPLLAQWFLCTRGLRAQRVALATGSDELVAALRESLEQLNRLEGELLGAWRAHESPDALRARGGERSSPAADALRLAEWRALREAVARAMAGAVREGRLPPALQLSARDAAQRLAPHQALVIVARLDRTRLVVLTLRQQAPLRAAITLLPSALADAPCDLLNAVARQALRHDFGAQTSRDASALAPRRIALAGLGDAAAGDRLALAAMRELAERAVAPALRDLLAADCSDIAIVPADDLHLLPWGELARCSAAGDAAVAVYPSAGAWWRCRALDGASPHEAAAPRWALACAAGTVSSAGAPRLPWAEIERRQSQRLWPAAPGARADTLLAIGHSALPAGNPARAGLRLDDGRVLAAHDVAAGGFDRVLLSACMLGRTDDAFGEALGFLSTCFAYRARFGVGWLTEVPDEAACLFSLAFQFALRSALDGKGAPPRWSAVFHATCRAVEQGAWPAGFAAWLADGWPEAAAVPPPSLRRVLPWVVALGD